MFDAFIFFFSLSLVVTLASVQSQHMLERKEFANNNRGECKQKTAKINCLYFPRMSQISHQFPVPWKCELALIYYLMIFLYEIWSNSDRFLKKRISKAYSFTHLPLPLPNPRPCKLTYRLLLSCNDQHYTYSPGLTIKNINTYLGQGDGGGRGGGRGTPEITVDAVIKFYGIFVNIESSNDILRERFFLFFY